MNSIDALLTVYDKAKEFVNKMGYADEIKTVAARRFENISSSEFLYQYIYVVVNSGMKNQVAEKILRRFIEKGPDAIGHLGKRTAIKKALINYTKWWTDLQSQSNKIDYLETLPWIDPITKFHLARNLGLNVAKPDRHLVRLADKYGFKTAHEMCAYLAEKTGDRIGVIDVILWRYINLRGLVEYGI